VCPSLIHGKPDGGFAVRASGEGAKIFEKTDQVLKGAAALEEIDARLIQPYYTKRLAEAAGMPLSLALDGADVVVSAVADIAKPLAATA